MKIISSFVMLSCLISNLIFFYSYATPITDMNEVLIQKNENEVTKMLEIIIPDKTIYGYNIIH